MVSIFVAVATVVFIAVICLGACRMSVGIDPNLFLYGERTALFAAPWVIGDKAVLDQPFDDTEQSFGLDMFEGFVEIFARLAVAASYPPYVPKSVLWVTTMGVESYSSGSWS